MDAATLRARFPVVGTCAYLNAGTDGPVPEAAVAAATRELERALAEGRTKAFFERRRDARDALRESYAGLLGCAAADVATTTSTSEGVAIAVSGLGLRSGDEILTSDEEHPGMLGPLQAARDIHGVTVRTAPLGQLPDAVGPSTRLVACCHVGWMTGAVAPAELAELDVPVLLDGAQAVGAVPVDFGALGCDVYAASGQKWLCGADGTGMLYVSPAIRDRLVPAARSYISYVEGGIGLDAELHPDARRYDSPALPGEGVAFSNAAFEVLEAFGWERVHARGADLAGRLAEALSERGHEVAPRGQTTLVSWATPDAEAARDRLREQGVVLRDIPGRGLLRASVGAWNDEGDLDRLMFGLS